MIQKSIYIFKSHFLTALICVLFVDFLEIWGNFSSIFPTTIVSGLLVYIYHDTLLFGTKIDIWKSGKNNPFPGLNFWLACLFPILVSLAVFNIALLIIDVPRNQLMGLILIVLVPLFGIVISFFGTMIPAAVMEESISPFAALKRSRKTFWFIFWRLIIGPFIYSVVIFISFIWMGKNGYAPEYPSTLSQITVWSALYYVTFSLLGVFNNALTASILSMAYAKSKGETLPELKS